MLSIGERTIIYIGDLFFIILVAFILYRFQLPILFLSLLIISFSFNLLWLRVISDSKKYSIEERSIKHTYDQGTPYLSYLSSYISILPLLNGTIYGLIGFGVITIVFYFVYIGSSLIYFNPFLAAFGYKFYLAVTEEGDEIYLISKEAITPNQKKKLYQITDYTYLVASSET
ncbi:MAG: hypothetical protein ACP5GR_05980 [Thermoplasmata archaeon]|jgi:hypothetical protein